MNAGPARLAQWMVTMDYCRELGVPWRSSPTPTRSRTSSTRRRG
ncbi:hypothetical protein ACFQX6_24205 [Streptosporangium lutulentum]